MKGRGTELISIYIPKGKDVIPYLKQEKATAKNIKSDRVRHEVEKNLERCIQRLRNKSKKGISLFSGNNHLYEIEVECPWYYRCSKVFQTEMIDSSLNSSNKKLALISLDMKECGFGFLGDMSPKLLKVITSGIPSKHSKGGQSQLRFNHLHAEAKRDWFKRVAEYARYYFLDNGKVDRLIIHGESFTKREFIKANLLEYRLQRMVELSDGCYAGEDGLYECFNMMKNNE